ncbi:hypothetical protein EPUS_01926 [Endocarpon pusillum Z07020]|uniref:Uncharacterized protein n=1 Tax=Endocarpon pusillum (strain Z07020 / HMAS-L-300199) TaxID=1263415 RepID=U1GD22_ENDPU|nr:uncharacterized protein EPUS_01926 [Endocarpon pusillum Z07020]ERF69596.1 hypothetical protein EPUS_01926 [Endocarpon pusillum Z07020]
MSLDLGPPIVQGQYDSDFRKFGETYARGDSIAREQLKDVLITLQMAVLSNLTGVWTGTRSLDYKALQVATDDSRVNAVMCLIQWQQRLSSAATAQQQKSPPYPLDSNSRPMTPPLTNASSHSDRSSVVAGRCSTPEQTNEQMAPLGTTPRSSDSASAYSVSPRPTINHHTFAHPQPDDRSPIEMPSPLFARARPVVGQDSWRSPNVPHALPVRSPYRPTVTTTEEMAESRPMPDNHSPHFPSPISPFRPEHEHQNSDGFGSNGQSRSLDSPTINYDAASCSPTAHDSARRAPSLGTIAPQGQRTSSDHSTLEPVSLDNTTPTDIHPAFRTDPYSLQAYAASFASARPQDNPLPPVPAPPYTDSPALQHPHQGQIQNRISSLSASAAIPQSATHNRSLSASAPIPVLSRRPYSSNTTSTPRSSTDHRPSHSYPQPQSQSHTERHLSQPQSLTLPSESNAYHGFCKSAYKLQIGLPHKKAFSIETRPAGIYSNSQVWRCAKCSFEGPVFVSSGIPNVVGGVGKKAVGKPEKAFDPRLRVSESGGVRYRWVFLAKCHVMTKNTAGEAARMGDGSFGTFGCLFCCAEGVGRGWIQPEEESNTNTNNNNNKNSPNNSAVELDAGPGAGGAVAAGAGFAAAFLLGRRKTLAAMPTTNTTTATTTTTTNHNPPTTPTPSVPMFGNVQSFMQHLEMHRTEQGTPGVEMQGRMKCVVGRAADPGEDFDVNFLPLVEL